MKISLKLSSLVLLTLLSGACRQSSESKKDATEVETAQTEKAESAPQGEWVDLFDGKSLAGWHGYNKTGEVKNWTVQDGALVCLGAAKDAHGGDLVSDKQYS